MDILLLQAVHLLVPDSWLACRLGIMACWGMVELQKSIRTRCRKCYVISGIIHLVLEKCTGFHKRLFMAFIQHWLMRVDVSNRKILSVIIGNGFSFMRQVRIPIWQALVGMLMGQVSINCRRSCIRRHGRVRLLANWFEIIIVINPFFWKFHLHVLIVLMILPNVYWTNTRTGIYLHLG